MSPYEPKASEDLSFDEFRLPFWVPAAAVTALGLAVIITGRSDLLGIGDFPNFSDLHQVTSTADCVAANPHWSPLTASCDPWFRSFNYPMIWARAFAWLGLGAAQNTAIGYALVGCYALFALVLSRLVLTRVRGVPAVLFMLSVAAPTAIYLLVRGNTDTIVLLMLAGFVAAVAAGRPVIAMPLIALASALKIFPAFAWMGLFASVRRKRLAALVGALSIIAALALEGSDIARVARQTPQGYMRSFGISVWPSFIHAHYPALPGSARLDGLALLALVTLLVWAVDRATADRRAERPSTTRLLDAAEDNRPAKLLLYTGSGLTVLTYASGSSFDYRLQVLTFVVGGLCLLWQQRISRVLVVTLLVAQYFSFVVGTPLDLISETGLMVAVGYLALVMVEALWRELLPSRPRPRAEAPEPRD